MCHSETKFPIVYPNENFAYSYPLIDCVSPIWRKFYFNLRPLYSRFQCRKVFDYLEFENTFVTVSFYHNLIMVPGSLGKQFLLTSCYIAVI